MIFARDKNRATRELTMPLRKEDPRESRYVSRFSELDFPNPQAVVGPRGDNAGYMVAQEDIDEAANKAVDAQLGDENALQRTA